MLATDRLIVGLVVTGGCLIAAAVEAAHPAFLVCFGVAFAAGAIAAEVARVRRRRTIRSLPR
jgi:hypothetical protein